MGLNLKKKVKRVARKITPKPLRSALDKGISFLEKPYKYSKKVAKSVIRAPGKWIKPKMPGDPAVIQETDEELVGLTGKRRTARRRGSRSNSMLSN